MNTVFRVPLLLAAIFNKLPSSLKRSKKYAFYFSNGIFSCIKYKSFDGWYWAGKEDLWNLLKYQLRRIK